MLQFVVCDTELCAISYENPLVTATSRDKIADLYGLCRACSALDIPRPLAFISSLLRHVSYDPSQVLLRGVRAWSEVGDISESESFGEPQSKITQRTS